MQDLVYSRLWAITYGHCLLPNATPATYETNLIKIKNIPGKLLIPPVIHCDKKLLLNIPVGPRIFGEDLIHKDLVRLRYEQFVKFH